MQPVECSACGQRVLVEKYSPIHTSVQWPARSEVRCPYRAASLTGRTAGEFVTRCDGLDEAVRGAVEGGVVAESYRPEILPERIS